MADKLLIRVFDVGLGDCVYCRIPDGHRDGGPFHILIDCGSLSGSGALKEAVAKLKTDLPDATDGRKRLDLLVVTHEHKDHISGFGLPIWDNFAIGAIWMNAAMDPKHPQAEKTKKLRSVASALMGEALRLGVAMSPEWREFAEALALGNDAALTTLRETLPKRCGIKPTYVHAGSEDAAAALPLVGATLTVIGPEPDIDGVYLGRDGDESLHGFMGAAAAVGAPQLTLSTTADLPAVSNVDPADFRKLRARMQSSALAFADLDGKVTNNTSVVLLLQWNGHRLLFVGDAEWDGKYKDGKGNCSWNVMWNQRRALLDAPVSFLKIGHHGSVNATPWGEVGSEPRDILDAILPVARRATARAVASTRRANYETIPRSELLAVIGERVGNTRDYASAFASGALTPSDVPKFDAFEKQWFDRPQALRTDFERLLQGPGYVDVELDPSPAPGKPKPRRRKR